MYIVCQYIYVRTQFVDTRESGSLERFFRVSGKLSEEARQKVFRLRFPALEKARGSPFAQDARFRGLYLL